MSEKVKVFITKYALTAGIIETEAEITDYGYARYYPKGQNTWNSVSKSDWHTRKADAQAKAEQMRQKKVASLQKQIKALEQLKFD